MARVLGDLDAILRMRDVKSGMGKSLSGWDANIVEKA